jgi:CRP-like cAMP-binding protein
MLQTTVEKVIALKKVSIFAETPDEILAEIASVLEETAISEGETLFEKGDPGNCMFIVVEGQILIHDGERALNRLGGGDIFGEMAVLDVEPRMATATAEADSYLLRLDQELLYELMEGRIEVARGIIHVLSRRLRVASTQEKA